LSKVVLKHPRELPLEATAGRSRKKSQEPIAMQIGMIGLGRMGANMVRRLMKHQHECVVYDRSPDGVKAMEN